MLYLLAFIGVTIIVLGIRVRFDKSFLGLVVKSAYFTFGVLIVLLPVLSFISYAIFKYILQE